MGRTEYAPVMGVGHIANPSSSMRGVLVGVALENDAAGYEDTTGCTADCTAVCTAGGIAMMIIVAMMGVVMVMQHRAGGGGGGRISSAGIGLLHTVLESDELIEPCHLISSGSGAAEKCLSAGEEVGECEEGSRIVDKLVQLRDLSEGRGAMKAQEMASFHPQSERRYAWRRRHHKSVVCSSA